MKERIREPKPMVKLEYDSGNVLEIYVLDEDDVMAWNSSTNYDHHMSGPSLVFKRKCRGIDMSEHYVNDPDQWLYIEKMMRLGLKYLEDNPDFDMLEFEKELKEERAQYKPHVSFHKNK